MAASNKALTASERRSFWRRSEQTRSAYGYLLPALAVLAVITLFPLLFQIWMSFTDYGLTNLDVNSPPPNFVGFDNYLQILQNSAFLKAAIPNFDFWRLLSFNLVWAVTN